jgi:tRNA(fMet)-specific endonuclease VapC
MDGSSYFLDTNIIVEFFRGNSRVAIYLAENKRFVISTIVLGELEFGVQKAKKAAKNTKQLKDFMTGVQVINLDERTAILYGKIKTELRKLGKPIPDNDIWIAALAMQHNAVLITNDAHFKSIEALEFKQI